MRLARGKMRHASTRVTTGGRGPVFAWLGVWGFVGAVTVAGPGCGGASTGTGVEETGPFLEQTLAWDQGAGSEILQCHTFQLPNDEPIDVNRVRFIFGAGSHHVHIYRSTTPRPEGVADCPGGVPWPDWEMVVGAQTKPLDWKLPSGLSVPFAAHQQLLVQVHWLNVTPEPLHGRIKLRFSVATEAGTPVGTLFGVNERVAVGPHERQVLTQECPLPEDAHILAMMGHFHGLGRGYDASLVAPDGTTTSVYTAADESTLVLSTFDPPLQAPPGASLSFSCEYVNTREIPATWGANTASEEHCNVVAYYYPANDSASWCIRDFAKTGAVAAVDVPAGEIAPGDDVPLTVRLAEPAPEDTLVRFSGDTMSALAIGPFAIVPAGEQSVVATAHALKPVAAAAVQAQVLDSHATAQLRVGGLVLSEIMAWPAAAASGTWVEVANLGTLPIDLSPFALAKGGQSTGGGFAPSVRLSGSLEGLGCTVVQLDAGPGQAGGDGVALVQVTDGIDSVATTFDSVVYGGPNTFALPDRTGMVAVPIPAAASGQSLARRSTTVWSAQTPTPGICEVVRP